MTPTKTDNSPTRITRELLACAANTENSQQKKTFLLDLPRLVIELGSAIAEGRYVPQPLTVFAVTEPKLREIFAPAYADRLVHQWVVQQIGPWYDATFIDDSFANRKGKGTDAAIVRLQGMLRKHELRWYCQLDIRSFFPSISREILLKLWAKNLPKLPITAARKKLINQVVHAILLQNPAHPAPHISGRRSLLAAIPRHKSLMNDPDNLGLPIGSLTSQFFANVLLNELDQYVKHALKIKGYIRYVDDFIILGSCPKELMQQKIIIQGFLENTLKLSLHPNKTVLQRCTQGINFLGNIIYPTHRLVRQRSVRALRKRLHWFRAILTAQDPHTSPAPQSGTWHRWLQNNSVFLYPKQPNPAFLQRMQATINSYYGLFQHTQSFTLRKHIYQQELGILKAFFLPSGPEYHHLKLRPAWQLNRKIIR